MNSCSVEDVQSLKYSLNEWKMLVSCVEMGEMRSTQTYL